MGWMRALFGNSDESTSEFVRLTYRRALSKTSGRTDLERRMTAAAESLKAYEHSIGINRPVEECMFEALPFAMLDEGTADVLGEYILYRREFARQFLGARLTETYRTVWLRQQVNKGVHDLLTDDSALLTPVRVWFKTSLRENTAHWLDWLSDENRNGIRAL